MRLRIPERAAKAWGRTWFLLGLGLLFGAYLASRVAAPGAAAYVYNALLVACAYVALRTPHRHGPERAAWLCLGAALCLWAAGDFYYTLFLVGTEAAPPTVTDWLWLASYPLLYAAVALLVRARTAHLERSLWLDAVLAALAVAAVGAAALFGPVLETTGGSPVTALMNVAYPLADALLLGLVVSVLALTGWRLDRAWICLLGATATLALSDGAFLYEAVTGGSRVTSVIDAGWPLAMLLLAAAAWQPARRRAGVRLEGARVLAVPATFGLVSLAILVYGQFVLLNLPTIVLAATSLVAVIARMALTFRDKLSLLAATEREARTDALTGVGNRRKLMTDLGALLETQTPATLMLLDLDGFKSYNDSFGHPAGDALLARLAKKLAAAIDGAGEVYRIGGDEFCVLAPVDAAGRAPLAAAAQEALQERGEGFRITAAAGIVALPEEAADVAEALRLVDTRMYDEKDGRRASAGRQSRDVLLRALYERDARLQGHLREVVELARAVAGALGLPPEQVADVALAAELHEVGKLAIPDSILRKAEPLTDDEARFLRRHPLIGERILSSAPALAKVSRVVRGIHERVDGSGYPDGLRGAEIPLPARIIGACVAFVELTRGAERRSAGDAVEELRADAGAAFDPDVVEALAAVEDVAAAVPAAAA